MKPSRDEVLRMADEAELVVLANGKAYSAWTESTDLTPNLERFAAAMYEALAANEKTKQKKLKKHLEDANRGAERNALINLSLVEKLAAERAVSDRLLAELRFIAEWIIDIPTPTRGATAQLKHIDAAIAKVEAMRKEQE